MRRQLESVEAALAAEPSKPQERLAAEVCRPLLSASAKRLRPALALVAARFGNPEAASVLQVAVAVELLHTATLLHDDIADEASTRRGLPTANARWGHRVAAFAGAWLFAKTVEAFSASGDAINAAASRAVDEVWRGQKQEANHAFRLDGDERSALAIAEWKTAALYVLASRAGALAAGAPEPATQALADFGRALGIAFQLVDDVLDLVSDAQELGKPAGADLREGIYTLPVLRALHAGRQSERLRSVLRARRLEVAEMEEAIALIRGSDAIPYTLDRIASLLEQARKALLRLPPGAANDSLESLTRFVVARLDPWTH